MRVGEGNVESVQLSGTTNDSGPHVYTETPVMSEIQNKDKITNLSGEVSRDPPVLDTTRRDEISEPQEGEAAKQTDEQYGPLTGSEADRLQAEANEDTTKSEDLRQFLKEMHEKLLEEQKQSANQLMQNITNMYAAPEQMRVNPQASEYALTGSRPPIPDSDDYPQVRRLSNTCTNNTPYNRLTSQVNRTSMTDITAPETVSPDGGWGWIVVLGSFCCMVLVDGICFSYGLLLSPQCGYSNIKVLESGRSNVNRTIWPLYRPSGYSPVDPRFKPVPGSCVPESELGSSLGTQNRSLLLLPGALLIGLYLLLGPLISALTNQFDFRPVAMTGAVLTTIALFVSSFATSINVLIATFGVLGGIGFALIYLPAIATVGHWFQQQRPLAVGLALCGSGVGWLAGGQAIPRLIDWLTWRGALIILAATSFQCLSLIVLFRPVEVHMRITQIQRAKRMAREAARREAAIRRAEAERLLIEARQRKRLAAAKAAAEARGQFIGGYEKTGADANCDDQKYGANGMVGRGVGRVGTVITRTSRGGHVISVAPAGQSPYSGGVDSANAVPSRTGSGRSSWGKRAASRRVVVYRGSIMQRIIEEKRRQRTISVGSLDGMVITRDNELIAAPMGAGYDRPLLTASTIHRISESVARKIEAKICSQQMQQQNVNAGGVTPNAVTGSRLGLSRSQLRANLPQVVHDYIQSQLSMSLQQQLQQLRKPSITYLPHQQTSEAPSDLPPTSPTLPAARVVAPSQNSYRDSTTIPPTTAVRDALSAAMSNTDNSPSQTAPAVPSPPSNAIPSPGSPSLPPAVSTTVSASQPNPSQLYVATAGISNCGSESVSLRRTVSDASLDSQIRGTNNDASGPPTSIQPDETSSTNPVVELLDDEIKSEINARLRKEMFRPQYKKDLFFAGSVHQIGPGCQATSATTGALPTTGLMLPPTPVGSRPRRLRTSSAVTAPQVTEQLQAETDDDSRVIANLRALPFQSYLQSFLHNSQTNLSLATSVGTTVTNTFIPPAPCPVMQQANTYSQVPLPSTTNMDGGYLECGQEQQPQDTALAPCSPGSLPDESRIRTGAFIAQTDQLGLGDDSSAFGPDPSVEPTGDDGVTCDVAVIDDVADDGINDLDDDVGEDIDAEDIDDVTQVTFGLLRVSVCSKCCPTCCLDAMSPVWSFIQELLSPWILTSPTFILMLLSSFVTMLGFIIPFWMLPDLLAELDLKLSDSGFAISAIGVGNTVGRLVATAYIEKGWSSVYKWANCVWLNNASLLFTGFIMLSLPGFRTYPSLVTLLCVLFGLCSAVFVSLKSILVVELLGLDRLTNAFGYMLLFQGIAAIIGPPVTGYLYDLRLANVMVPTVFTAHSAPVHQAASVSFYFSGACFILACLLACPLRWLAQREAVGTSGDGRSSMYNPPTEWISNTPGYAYDGPSQAGDSDAPYIVTEAGTLVPDTNRPSVLYIPDQQRAQQPPLQSNSPLPEVGSPRPTTPSVNVVNPFIIGGQNVPPTPSGGMLPPTSPAGGAVSVNTAATTPLGLLDRNPPCGLPTITESVALGAPTPPAAPAAVPPLESDTNTSAALVVGTLNRPVPNAPASTATAPTPAQSQPVETHAIKEDSGLEPVVEEEEEYEEEPDENTDAEQTRRESSGSSVRDEAVQLESGTKAGEVHTPVRCKRRRKIRRKSTEDRSLAPNHPTQPPVSSSSSATQPSDTSSVPTSEEALLEKP
ncbi:unnamed protein product [Calicophoron daubneyi]|uniref:Monocarboxylate transporter n=1 Tax=Calicophoron daubneyi TaxID=300641 RepID=A0AAV2T1U5_CALDB